MTNEEQTTDEALRRESESLRALVEENSKKIAELSEVNSDLENLLHSTSLGVMFLDRELKLRRFTPALTSVIPLSASDVGKPFVEIRHSFRGLASEEELVSTLRAVLAHGRVERSERRSADGKWYLLSVLPYVTGGDIEGVVLTASDITDQRLAQLERNRYVRKLEALGQDLQDFAHVASHDLQAPLRAIVGFTNLLLEDDLSLSEEQAQWLDLIRSSGTQMQTQIEALLMFSRVHTRGAEARMWDCNHSIDKALESLESKIEECGASIVRSFLPTLSADGNQLTQVFRELISNALIYNESVPPRVNVSATQEGDEWLFRVEDNGIGVPEKRAKEIFIVFRRLHASHEYQGTGVGLALCKRIVERHGGRIWVEPADQGSAFIFSLPVTSETKSGSSS